jgi:signal transduction histidine kinase
VRRRLLLVLLPLLGFMLVAIEVPLAASTAKRLTNERTTEHLFDMQRLEEITSAPLRDGALRRVRKTVDNYHRAHSDSDVLVVDREGKTVIALRRPSATDAAAVTKATRLALDGQRPRFSPTAWPWSRRPIVLGASLERNSTTVGALVAVVQPDGVRDAVTMRLGVLVASWFGVMLLATLLCVLPLARWILQPVGDLSAAAERIAAGRPHAGVSEHGGPPELRSLATSFNRMASSVAAALERQRSLAASASHQLRNPVTALRLRMDNLALHVAPDGEADLRAALHQATELSTTIDTLLRHARAEATAAELVVADIAELVVARIDAWRSALDPIEVLLELPADGDCRALCHADAVEQALEAVLDNARKFGDGSVVEIAVAVLPGEVRVRVRDHGPGLSEAERASAMELFWRSPRHQNHEGTGLGLTIVRSLLETGGARLELHDAEPGLAADVVIPAAATRCC